MHGTVRPTLPAGPGAREAHGGAAARRRRLQRPGHRVRDPRHEPAPRGWAVHVMSARLVIHMPRHTLARSYTRHVIHHIVYWCSPRHPPHSVRVLLTSPTPMYVLVYDVAGMMHPALAQVHHRRHAAHRGQQPGGVHHGPQVQPLLHVLHRRGQGRGVSKNNDSTDVESTKHEIGQYARARLNARTMVWGAVGLLHHEPSLCACMSIHPEGKSCSDLGLGRFPR